jgi:hypothetical protein
MHKLAIVANAKKKYVLFLSFFRSIIKEIPYVRKIKLKVKVVFSNVMFKFLLNKLAFIERAKIKGRIHVIIN